MHTYTVRDLVRQTFSNCRVREKCTSCVTRGCNCDGPMLKSQGSSSAAVTLMMQWQHEILY
jgi:hypothetical protein